MKYEVNYSCGCGSVTKQLFGPNKERERKIEWMEANMLCPECYKKQMQSADAASPKQSEIALVPGLGVTLQISVTGQIEENKQKLYDFGFCWEEKASGMMGYFSTKAPARVLAKSHNCKSVEDAQNWIEQTTQEIGLQGYQYKSGFGPLDAVWMHEEFSKLAEKSAAIAAREKAIKADPMPLESPLRARIRDLEKTTGSKWNGKIYGKKGYYNFYVANEKHDATDQEVAEREENLKTLSSWKERNPEIK